MAIAKSGLLRGLKGKAAGLVMSQTKQGTIVREYKDSITNPKTPAQQANRDVFKAAVERASQAKNSVFKMYGTNRMPSYSKLVSMIMKNIGGKATRSFLNGIRVPVPAMLNQIGVNNPDYKLGVLDLSLVKIVHENSWLSFELFGSGNSSAETLYFGCDYAISDVNILFVSINEHLNQKIYLTSSRIGGVIGAEKKVGYFSSEEACGLGWNYIYGFKPYSTVTSEDAVMQHSLHYTFDSLSGSGTRPFYKPAVYETNGINKLGDYWYASVIVWSSLGNATLSKTGCLLLSSGNFYQRLRDTAISNS